MKYRVRCTVCGWTGYRSRRWGSCECYDDWALYCRPDSPGPGCPSWVTYPCPKGHLRPGRERLDYPRDSAVEIAATAKAARLLEEALA